MKRRRFFGLIGSLGLVPFVKPSGYDELKPILYQPLCVGDTVKALAPIYLKGQLDHEARGRILLAYLKRANNE